MFYSTGYCRACLLPRYAVLSDGHSLRRESRLLKYVFNDLFAICHILYIAKILHDLHAGCKHTEPSVLGSEHTTLPGPCQQVVGLAQVGFQR